jgi:hypothetical protein
MADVPFQQAFPTAMPPQNADTPFASGKASGQLRNPYGSPPPFRSANRPEQMSMSNGDAAASPNSTGFNTPMNPTGTSTGAFATGALALTNGPEGQGKTGTMRLAQSVKVVQVPVAGQPGRYVTGFLPVLSQTDTTTLDGAGYRDQKDKVRKKVQLITIIASVVLIVLGSFMYLVQPFSVGSPTGRFFNPNGAATAAAATAQANTILSDPLSQPIHNWPIVTDNTPQYVFKDGAYHVGVGDHGNLALPLLPGENYTNMAYTITWQEVNGDDTAQYDWFGIVLRYSEHQSNGNTVKTFYAFVYSPSAKEYEFNKYNDSNQDNPWTTVWKHGNGKEYSVGHNNKNTVKVVSNGSKFTFIVNGKQVGTAQDKDLTSGQIGMIVNLNGFEIAYSNLALTYN